MEFHYGQVWLVKINNRMRGSVESKTRPMIVVSNEKNNKFAPTVNMIPLTSSRMNTRGAYQVQFYLGTQQYPQIALCEQITTVDKSQCTRYMYQLSDEILTELKLSMRIQLNL